MQRMCPWMVWQTKEQRGNKNQNELVMAVIKYSLGFYLQPVIKLPLSRFMEMLAPQSKTLFCQGHVNNLHSAFWIYWRMDILSNRALQTRKQVLKKSISVMLIWYSGGSGTPARSFAPSLRPTPTVCWALLLSLASLISCQIFFYQTTGNTQQLEFWQKPWKKL